MSDSQPVILLSSGIGHKNNFVLTHMSALRAVRKVFIRKVYKQFLLYLAFCGKLRWPYREIEFNKAHGFKKRLNETL